MLLRLLSCSSPPALAADSFRKLKDAEIKARLAGMEITDGVHWAEQYMRDGTFKAFHMGKPAQANGRSQWRALPRRWQGGAECKEVWVSGNKVEFRGQARDARMEGILQKQQMRDELAESCRTVQHVTEFGGRSEAPAVAVSPTTWRSS